MSPTGNIIGQLVLLALVVLAFGYFFWRVGQLYQLMRTGAPDDRSGDHAVRLRRFAAMVLANNKLFDRPGIGLAHFLIFWGFIIITVGTFERLIAGLLGRLRIPVIGTAHWFIAINDVLAVLVIASLLYAAYRRLRVRPWFLTTLPDAFVIILMIGGHLSAFLLSEAFAAAVTGAEGEHWSLPGWCWPAPSRRSARPRRGPASSPSGGSTWC